MRLKWEKKKIRAIQYVPKDIILFEESSASASLIYEHTYGTFKIAIHPRTLIFYDIHIYN